MTLDPATQTHLLGLAAATTAAFFWSVSVTLYRRVGRLLPPIRLNFIKGVVASLCIGVYVLFDWLVLGHTPWALSLWMLVLMALSGLIGIGLGDTLLFAGLNRMGARRMLLLFTINPVITAVVAWLFLDEPLSGWQIVGVALTCAGVAWVIAERTTGKADGHVDALGLAYGLGAASCEAAGVLLSRFVFEQGEITAASSAWLRVAAGSLVLFLFFPLDNKLRDPGGRADQHPNPPSRRQAVMMFGVALLLGTVLGICLMQVAVKWSGKVGIASTLLSTSPLFVLPIAAMLGDRISPRAVLGAVISVVGIALLYMVAS